MGFPKRFCIVCGEQIVTGNRRKRCRECDKEHNKMRKRVE